MVGKEIYVLDQLADNVGMTVCDVLELVTCSRRPGPSSRGAADSRVKGRKIFIVRIFFEFAALKVKGQGLKPSEIDSGALTTLPGQI